MKISTLAPLVLFGLASTTAIASHTPAPTSVTVAGSFQSEIGCPGDWDPSCVQAQLGYDSNDEVWQGSYTIPAGNWEYKAALNGSWTENYGAGAAANGSNVALASAASGPVKFYYDHETHWITSSLNSIIVVAAGSFQSELGCSGDWDPSCLRSWLQDIDGDGIYTFATTLLPAGNYEWKVALYESWDENYGVGGAQNGANLMFTVPLASTEVLFSWDSRSKIPFLSIGGSREVPEPSTLGLLGLGLVAVGMDAARRRRGKRARATY